MPRRDALKLEVDHRVLDFEGMPSKAARLEEGQALQARVPALAAECLETYITARTALATASQPLPPSAVPVTQPRRVFRPRPRRQRPPTRPSTRLRSRRGHRHNNPILSTTPTWTRLIATTPKHRGRVAGASSPTVTTPQADAVNNKTWDNDDLDLDHDHNDDDGGGDTSPAAALACPFYKHDPVRHRACAWDAPLPTTRSAKQHVIVYHHAPLYCPICAAHFPSAVARDAHVRARGCALVDLGSADSGGGIEGATEEQIDALLLRRRGETEEAGWFRMWDVLFRGEARPETAYLAAQAEREIVALRRFWARAGPGEVRRLLGPGEDEATVRAVARSVLPVMVELAGW